jgi:formylglycine-generating enzyme required for sulfatase activity
MNNFNMRYAFGLLCCCALFACSNGNDVAPTNESPIRDTDTNADNSEDSDTNAANSEDSDTNRPVPNRDADKLSGLESTPDIDWLTIEKGTFTFGSPPTSPCRAAYSETEFPVTLTRSFLIAATELTQAQWEALDLPHASWSKGAEMPVTLINFFEVAAWCNKLSRLENLEPCYDLSNCFNFIGTGCIQDGQRSGRACSNVETQPIFFCKNSIHRFPDRYSCPGYRLPTSAEWEYAAKAGVTETHTYGGDLHNEPLTACNEQPALEDIAWYCHNSGGEVHPVAKKQPNPWGLYDTLGNVYEWVDTFHNGGAPLSYETPGTPLTDPVGSAYADRIEMRGCHYEKTGCQLRPTERSSLTTTARWSIVGFRPVRTILE